MMNCELTKGNVQQRLHDLLSYNFPCAVDMEVSVSQPEDSILVKEKESALDPQQQSWQSAIDKATQNGENLFRPGPNCDSALTAKQQA